MAGACEACARSSRVKGFKFHLLFCFLPPMPLLLLLLLRNFTLGESRIESRFNKTKTTSAESVELPR